MINDEDHEEIAPEETELSVAALSTKLKNLRKELRACQKERDEHLAGWQRAKADLVNLRRMSEEDTSRARARATAALAREVLPALDSFEAATQAPEWLEVAEQWRTGVHRIESQLRSALTRSGLSAYGSAGDTFDPSAHECMSVQVTPDAAQDHTLAQVLQKGYRLGDEVVRPAKVVVFQHSESPPE